ncbi:hypothetical protein GVAV_000531 [Gurleya vavrai]
MEKKFDIIIYGASSLAARFIIAHLLKKDVKLALSGRSVKTIKENLLNVSNTLPVIECSTKNIDLIVKQTRILINCAGPYIFSGEKIIESCVRNKTHYLDITGETFFIEKIIYLYNRKAEENKVFVINCCGFDCVPADIGVEYFKEKINDDLKRFKHKKEFELKSDEKIIEDLKNLTNTKEFKGKNTEEITSLKNSASIPVVDQNYENNLFVSSILSFKNSAINKTTFESAVYGFGKVDETKELRRKNLIRINLKSEKLKNIFFDKRSNSYCTVFPGTDASIVRRTQSILAIKEFAYPCSYHAYFAIGNYLRIFCGLIFGLIFMVFSKFKLGRYLLVKFCNIFTGGLIKKRRPTEEEIKNGEFRFFFDCKKDSKTFKMEINGPDPAYQTTAICIGECAMVLLEILNGNDEGVKYKFKGGVLTPACAFYGNSIIEKLNSNGINFKYLNE